MALRSGRDSLLKTSEIGISIIDYLKFSLIFFLGKFGALNISHTRNRVELLNNLKNLLNQMEMYGEIIKKCRNFDFAKIPSGRAIFDP